MFNDFLQVALMSGFLGLARSFIQVPLPLVFAEYNVQRFPSAFGLYSVIFGIIAVMVGPFIGKHCVTFEARRICQLFFALSFSQHQNNAFGTCALRASAISPVSVQINGYNPVYSGTLACAPYMFRLQHGHPQGIL